MATDLGLVGDVGAHERRGAAGGGDEPDRLLTALGVHIGHRDLGPLPGERRADARPMPPAAPVTMATLPSNFPTMPPVSRSALGA